LPPGFSDSHRAHMKSQSNPDYYEFRHQTERDYAVASMRKYYDSKPEVVKFFEKLTAPFFREKPDALVLDACCGMGDLSYFLSESNPQLRFIGVDKASFLLAEGVRICAERPNVSFCEADVLQLSRNFLPQTFDFAVCKQTLSWLPSYQEAVSELMAVTKGSIFASSLFYDGKIDYNIRVREYETEVGRHDYNAHYNIYSFPVFREFCMSRGAKEVVAFDFDIEIDLPPPDNPDRMGTYTVRLDTGRRLQLSGALLMPWKIVRIDL